MNRISSAGSAVIGGRLIKMAALASLAVVGSLFVTLSQSPVYALGERYYLQCTTTRVTEGDSFAVSMIRVPNDSENVAPFFAWWRTEEGTADSSDYTPVGAHLTAGEQQEATESEQQARAITRTFYTTDDVFAEDDETFTVRFAIVSTIAVNPDDPDRDEKCEITIVDDDTLTVSTEVSTDGTEVAVRFNEAYGTSALLDWALQTFNISADVVYRAVFDVKVGSEWVMPTAASMSGDTLTLTMPTAIGRGKSVKVFYDNLFAVDSAGVFVGESGNEMQNFPEVTATNSSTVTGGSSGGNSRAIKVNVDDTRLSEGNEVTYKVKLSSLPTGKVTVSISNHPAGTMPNSTSTVYTSSLSADTATLTFNRNNWDKNQSVKLTGVEDADAVNFWSVVTHSARGGGYNGVTKNFRVLVKDDDLIFLSGQNVEPADFGPPFVRLSEGETKRYKVSLLRKPDSDVLVRLYFTNNDYLELTPDELIFTSANWYKKRIVKVTADVDPDDMGMVTVVRHIPEGGGFGRAQDSRLNVSIREQ